jgi:hypothetical protein
MKEDEFYISIEEAKKEIQKRWNNIELRKKVEEYLGKDIPEGFKNEPRAVLFRNIITPDLESTYFIEIAKKMNLKPYGLEYTKDKFCTRNSDKIAFGKLAFFEKRNKNGEAIIHYAKIIDMKKDDNKKLCDIQTFSGENLVEFHHNWLEKNIQKSLELYDMSEWVSNNGQSAKEYYKKFLAFFICHGVLFENFILDGEEKAFTLDTFLPAFTLVENIFGCKPLIVSAMPKESFGDKYWWCYSNDVFKQFNEKYK